MDVQSWNNGTAAFHPSGLMDRFNKSCNSWCPGSECFLTLWQGNHFSGASCKHTVCSSAFTEAREGALSTPGICRRRSCPCPWHLLPTLLPLHPAPPVPPTAGIHSGVTHGDLPMQPVHGLTLLLLSSLLFKSASGQGQLLFSCDTLWVG